MVHNCWRKKTTKTNCKRSIQRHRPFNLPAKTPLTTDWGFSKLREALASKDQNGNVCWKHFFLNFNMYYREACCVRGIMTTDQSPSWLSDRESWIRQGGEVGAPEKRPVWSEVGIPTGKGRMAFISKERESTGEDSTIPPSFMTYHDEVWCLFLTRAKV